MKYFDRQCFWEYNLNVGGVQDLASGCGQPSKLVAFNKKTAIFSSSKRKTSLAYGKK